MGATAQSVIIIYMKRFCVLLSLVLGCLAMNSQVADAAAMIPTEMVTKISSVMNSNT